MTDLQDSPPFRIGDKGTTDFYPKDRRLIREVIKVYPSHGQSGWFVMTKDQFGRVLDCDAAWYKKEECAK